MTRFDIEQLGEDRKDYLANLIARGQESFQSLLELYGQREEGHKLDISYMNTRTFNASVVSTGHHHEIAIEVACALLVEVLLQRVLSETHVIPELPLDQSSLLEWQIPFASLPNNVLLDRNFSFELDEHRFQISCVLADFCNMFVLFHEIGHICCGHTHGHRFYFSDGEYREYFDADKVLFRGRYLKRAWEIDADMFAGAIMAQFFDSFIEWPKSEAMANAFRFLEGDVSKLAALALSAPHVMFIYLARGNYVMRKRSAHPPPALTLESRRQCRHLARVRPPRLKPRRSCRASDNLHGPNAVCS